MCLLVLAKPWYILYINSVAYTWNTDPEFNARLHKTRKRRHFCCADGNCQGGGASEKKNPWRVTDSLAVQLFCDADGVVGMQMYTV